MDPQQEARYLGLGIVFESLAASIGSYRALATQQVSQLQGLQEKVKELEQKLEAASKPPA
jgi:hypothetical protein